MIFENVSKRENINHRLSVTWLYIFEVNYLLPTARRACYGNKTVPGETRRRTSGAVRLNDTQLSRLVIRAIVIISYGPDRITLPYYISQ